MRKIAFSALAVLGALGVASCGTNPEELTQDERVEIDSICHSTANSEVYDQWGAGGEWRTFGQWDLEEISGGFKTSGYFDSDETGPVPVSCEVEYPDIEVTSASVGQPKIDFKAAAVEACHQSVLNEARFPADVEFISTEVGNVSLLASAGARQFGVSGNADIPNAFGVKSRQGYICPGVIVNQDGTIRQALVVVDEVFRTNP